MVQWVSSMLRDGEEGWILVVRRKMRKKSGLIVSE